MVCVQPACRRTIGVVVVTGEELMRLVSDLRAKFPLTLISQRPPPVLKLIQALPAYLEIHLTLETAIEVKISHDASKFVIDVPML